MNWKAEITTKKKVKTVQPTRESLQFFQSKDKSTDARFICSIKMNLFLQENLLKIQRDGWKTINWLIFSFHLFMTNNSCMVVKFKRKK